MISSVQGIKPSSIQYRPSIHEATPTRMPTALTASTPATSSPSQSKKAAANVQSTHSTHNLNISFRFIAHFFLLVENHITVCGRLEPFHGFF